MSVLGGIGKALASLPAAAADRGPKAAAIKSIKLKVKMQKPATKKEATSGPR